MKKETEETKEEPKLTPKETEVKKDIGYDVSKPIYMVTRKREGRITIPLYEDVAKVAGYFKNLELPGTSFTVPFRRGWRGPVRNFTLQEGTLITLPKSLADHLNYGAVYKIEEWVTDTNTAVSSLHLHSGQGSIPPNVLRKRVKSHIQRFQFLIDYDETKKLNDEYAKAQANA